jgi:hypothetical protein
MNVTASDLIKVMLFGLAAIVIGAIGLETVLGANLEPLAETFGEVSPLSVRELFFAVFLVAGAGFGGRSLYIGTGALASAVWIGASDPLPADEVYLADGAVEIEGTAEPVVLEEGVEVTVPSPTTGTDCLAYTWEKQEERRSTGRRGRTTWTMAGENEESVPFFVADDTGRVAVDPAEATLSLKPELERKTHDTREYEGRLEPGDDVHVYGYKREVTGTDDRFAANHMYVSERLGDESVPLGEYLPDVSVFIGDHPEDKTFKISDAGELRTTLRSGVKGFLYSIGGIGLLLAAGFGTYYLLLS